MMKDPLIYPEYIALNGFVGLLVLGTNPSLHPRKTYKTMLSNWRMT